jgi:hypothetical protein
MSGTRRTPSGTFEAAAPPDEASIEQRVGREFRDIFGKGVTPAEVQRRLERALDRGGEAEKAVQLLRARFEEEDHPLLCAMFETRLKHNAPLAPWTKAVELSYEEAREGMRVIEKLHEGKT